MRARNLKPGFFKNEILGSADPLYGDLFQGLWCMADREGRLEDRPLRICAEIFPYRRNLTEKRIDAMLWWLDENGFVARYQIGAERFIQVLEFVTHQNPHKSERQSVIQPFTSDLHRARTGETLKEYGKKKDVAGLTPSSLTPDSGLLTPDSPFTDSPRTVQSLTSNGNAEGDPTGFVPQSLEQAQRLQAAYPVGIYRQSEWLIAQRLVNHHLAEGHAFDELLSGAERYRLQCEAKGSIRTQFVLSPVKFFDRESPQFADPFPLPRTKGDARQDANIDAAHKWLAQSEGK